MAFNFQPGADILLSADGAQKLKEVLEQHVALLHYDGIQDIEDGVEGRKGFKLVYRDITRNHIVPGVMSTIARELGSEDMNTIIKNGGIQRKRGTSSVHHGNLVHRHIYHQIECIQSSRKCTCDVRTKGQNKFAASAIRFLKNKGWRPVCSELALFSPEFDLATRIDILCATMQREYVLVSIKTGYSGLDKEKARFKFRKPLDSLDDTQRIRHQLQLLIEKLILERNYQMPILRCGVLYVNSDPKDDDRLMWRTPESYHIPDIVQSQIWTALSGQILKDNPPIVRSGYWALKNTEGTHNMLTHSDLHMGDGPSEHTLDSMIVDGT